MALFSFHPFAICILKNQNIRVNVIALASLPNNNILPSELHGAVNAG